MKKMSFENMKNVLSRNEMKRIMAGSGGEGCGTGITCSGKKKGDTCGSKGTCVCEETSGQLYCNTQV